MQGHAGRDMDDMWYPALWDEAIFFIMLGEEKKELIQQSETQRLRLVTVWMGHC